MDIDAATNKLVDEYRSERWTYLYTFPWVEQDCRCIYCCWNILEGDRDLWAHDHILPTAIYPELERSQLNLALACIPCNNAKKDWDPNTDGPQIYVPRSGKFTAEMRVEALRRATPFVRDQFGQIAEKRARWRASYARLGIGRNHPSST